MIGMRRCLYRAGGGLVSLALLVGGLACAEPYVFPDAWTDLPASHVTPGGVLHYYTDGDPRTFNPLVSVETNLVVELNNSPWHGAATLAWLRPDDGSLEPRAAESWTVSDGGLTVDVTLRPELRWSDGAQITAQDYVISFQLQSNPATGALGPEAWQIDGMPITVEATGPMSLRIRFPAVDRFAMHMLRWLYPLPDRVFGEAYRNGGPDAVTSLWGIDTPPSELVFSGYMRLAEMTQGERLSFERNPHFGVWNVDAAGRPLPYVDGVRFSYLSDETALALFLIGELDRFWPRGIDDIGLVNRAVAEDGLEALVVESAFPYESVNFLTFNWNLASDPYKQALFRSQNFRRAMAHLVNRADIVELAHSGAGFPLKTGVHPSYTGWFDEDLEVPAYDPVRSAELLAEIGFTGRDSNGYLIDAEGRRAGFTLNVVAGAAFAEDTASLFADAAREAGVDVQVQPLAFPLLVELITASGADRPFEAVFIGFSPADPIWPLGEVVYSCDGPLHLYNRSGGCLSATELLMSELVKRGRLTVDDAEAMRIAHEVQALEADLSAMIYTTVAADHYIASGRLAGHFPPELWSPRNGFGLPILTSVR